MNKYEEFILNNYKNMNRQDMAKYLNIPVGNVIYYLRKNNLVNRKLKFSNEDIDYMKQNYLNMSYKEIGDHLGYTERQIRGKINNMGLFKNRKINDDYFDNIDTSLKAYFLGFIFADGWIVINPENHNYEFGIELQSQDKYVLEKLNNELGGQNIIYHHESRVINICGKNRQKNESDELRIYSKKLVLGLNSNGIETNKTLKRTYPIVNDKFFFDFLRGYIDGDGCYWKNKKNYYLHITCATDSVLRYIQNKLDSYNIKTQIYQERDRKYRLVCSNICSMKTLVNLLYPTKDIFCLTRKFEKIKSYLTSLAA